MMRSVAAVSHAFLVVVDFGVRGSFPSEMVD